MRKLTLLIIDDDANIRNLLSELLSSRSDCRVLIAGDGKTAVGYLVQEKVDVVLTDIHMPGFTGLELMADMKKVKIRPEILVMTANATPENVEMARKIGARSVILKPFDNLDVVEAEIDKAVQAVHQGRGAGSAGAPEPPPPRRTPEPMAPERVAGPRPAPPRAAATGPRSASAPAARRAPEPKPAPVEEELPEIDAWKADLTGNETPAVEPEPRMVASAPSAPMPRARQAAPPPAARPAAPATPAARRAAPAPPPAPVEEESVEEVAEEAAPATEERIPEIPPDLDDIFRMVASLDVGKMNMQVPIICLQTWEEKGAIAALRRRAASLSREFYTWSAARGILKEDGHPMGEMYRDPGRALEFIRRHKTAGVFVLADFRQCLEDRTVVRTLREMVMELETARALLVLTAPRLPIPPELTPACACFDWPEGGGADLTSLYEEVAAEVSASSGRPVRLTGAARAALLERVKGMPAGRARFEIARALMSPAKRAS
jgi:CheY-like chemotaxis protein